MTSVKGGSIYIPPPEGINTCIVVDKSRCNDCYMVGAATCVHVYRCEMCQTTGVRTREVEVEIWFLYFITPHQQHHFPVWGW